MSQILFVLTAADHWTLADGTQHPTGFWAEEASRRTRCSATGPRDPVATPGGVVPTVDQGSLAPEVNGGQENADRSRGAGRDTELRTRSGSRTSTSADYEAVFYPGGHGPMEDLAVDKDSGRLLTAALDSGKPLGVVCHAPAALLAAAPGRQATPSPATG